MRDMRRIVVRLEQTFEKLMEFTTKHELKIMIEKLLSPREEVIVNALQSLIELGNQQSVIVYAMLNEVSAMQGLVSLLNHTKIKELRLLALRALSSVCCTVECIRSLEQCHGVDTIASLLNNGQSLEERVEAAGVLAQVTSPWITDNHKVDGLTKHVPSLVSTLTSLAGSATSHSSSCQPLLHGDQQPQEYEAAVHCQKIAGKSPSQPIHFGICQGPGGDRHGQCGS
jgi:hypothetical protein